MSNLKIFDISPEISPETAVFPGDTKFSRAEAMRGYNDDLVMSFSMGLWIRETALRLRAEGIELQKKSINNINSHKGVYTTETNQNDSWKWKVGKQQESLDWLIK